jgi:hypothetical protein
MLRSTLLALALATTAAVSAQQPDQPAMAPALDAPPTVAPPPNAAQMQQDAERVFTLFRHDLINLLILRADGRLLTAAAQIAAPDQKDASRSAIKKTPELLKRARQFAPTDPLVLWVSASNACLEAPGCADPASLKTLQTVDADNAAVWLLSFPSDGNAEKARGIVARMAQAQRYDDYWALDVVAIYHALETLPVPSEVLSQGVSTEAARVNFATSIASAILPKALQGLGKFCTGVDKQDTSLVSDCIAAARKLESGGTFISQGTGFGIEEILLPAGVDRDVMQSRRRSALWQKEQFFGLSNRFGREPALAQTYVRLLGSEQNELATVIAFLREQNLHTDPPGGWEPHMPKAADPLRDPAAPAATQQ